MRALPLAPRLRPRGRRSPRLATSAGLSLLAALTVAALGGVMGCSSSAAAPSPDASVDADAADGADSVHGDAAADGTATADTGPGCCAPGTCSPGQRCLQGRCHTAPGQGSCFLDGDCKPGQVCDAPTVCACGDDACEPSPGTCLYPPPCCNGDDDCAGGAPAGTCFEGTCQATPAGTCWADRQCPTGQVCEGVRSCPCGLSPGDPGCEGPAAPGYCALAGACCVGDAECGGGGSCVAGGCVPKPSAGRCYADAQCDAGQVCAGAYECPCDGDAACAVATTPGWCMAPSEAVCTKADQCGEAGFCAAHEGAAACAPLPAPGGCLEDANCGLGRTCYGASWDGGTPNPGVCRTEARACQDDAGCGPGMRCVLADRGWCAAPGVAPAPPAEGLCVPLADDGCWAKADCLPFERCTAEVICDDPAGCDAPNKPGFCTSPPLEGDCCTSHKECGPGYECRNSDTTMTCPPMDTATCLPVPDYGDSCWNFMDCPAGMVCNRVHVCPCNARCWRSHEGACELASEQYCNSDIDCGGEYTCARDLECLFNPCISSDDCGLGGECHLTLPGQCWSHAECGEGSYCKGLSLCPSDTTCPDNDQPGQCAPQEDAGACCQSYFACGAGLRCLSTVTKTECKLDPSSVCVPFGTYNQDCFSDADCAPNRQCVGAKVCACGVQSCTDAPQAGTCQIVE